MMTGILFSFPADWRRQILKLVLVLELVLVDCREIWLLNKRYIILAFGESASQQACNGSEFEDEFEFEDD